VLQARFAGKTVRGECERNRTGSPSSMLEDERKILGDPRLLMVMLLLCLAAPLECYPSSVVSTGRGTRYADLCVTAAKAKARPSGGGFGAVPAAAAPPRATEPLQTTSEVFRISEAELPSGEGINTMFMGAFTIEDPSVCDDLVALCESDPKKLNKGLVGRDGKAIVDPNSKESLEMSFQPNDPRMEWRRYVTALQQVTHKYVEKYPYAANTIGPWGLSSPTNYQYYPPGGGYKIFHTERNGRMEPGASRHLVFMVQTHTDTNTHTHTHTHTHTCHGCH